MILTIFLFLCCLFHVTTAENATYYNPVLPGWYSDPSCVQVEGIFYCVTSTFLVFPGLPVYASKDLINWKLVSHVWNREGQMPGASSQTKGQQEGFYAATIRHHDGEFWVACEYLGLPGGMVGTIFRSSDPYDHASWSYPHTFITQTGDLDLFWDDDGKLYIPAQGAVLQEVDLESGVVLSRVDLWPGTGGVWPEGPHIYRKDAWYYITLAEGGTETGHYQVMARSQNLTGPYTPHPHNPILTNRETSEYFQTVGHADFFQDLEGNWWAVALATRSGPEWYIYPMGRETVLVPVTWNEGDWPIMGQVRGKMNGWALPHVDRSVPGDGPFNSDPDSYTFPHGSTIPKNLVHWRVPPSDSISIPATGGLQLVPTRGNLTGDGGELDGTSGLAFIARLQAHSLFNFAVELKFDPLEVGQEAGAALFLTQRHHADLGIVRRQQRAADEACEHDCDGTERVLRFRVTGDDALEDEILQMPAGWNNGTIVLQIAAENTTHFTFSAAAASNPDDPRLLGTVSARLVSGQSGPFSGSLVGVYATCNGAGSGPSCPAGGEVTVQSWTYDGKGQYYSQTELVP